MSTHSSSPRLNLDFYRKQAKALLKAARQNDAEAIARLRKSVPRTNSDFALHDAQLAIARENKFSSWPRLRAHVISSAGAPKRFRPHERGFKWYEDRVEGVISVHKAGYPDEIASARRNIPRFTGASDAQIVAADLTEDDARLMLAKDHGFETWQAFKTHVDAIDAGKIMEPFTAAFDAIKSDAAAFSRLLKTHPDLVDALGTNGSSMLNLAANFNRVNICRQLLEAGADVDQPTTRGVTPLHAAALQDNPELIDMFMEAGASPEAFAFGDGGTPLTLALFGGNNDRAVEALKKHAIVPDNLRVAAGVGRLDLMQVCFDSNGNLTPNAGAHRGFYRPNLGWPFWIPSDSRQEILDEAFTYAARNGKIHVLDFLLTAGANIDADPYRGTALIWAVRTGRVDVIQWLLDHGAGINHRSNFGGPMHGNQFTALHAAVDSDSLDIVKLLIARGADPNLKDAAYNATPLGWAEHHGYPAICDFLRPLTTPSKR